MVCLWLAIYFIGLGRYSNVFIKLNSKIEAELVKFLRSVCFVLPNCLEEFRFVYSDCRHGLDVVKFSGALVLSILGLLQDPKVEWIMTSIPEKRRLIRIQKSYSVAECGGTSGIASGCKGRTPKHAWNTDITV